MKDGGGRGGGFEGGGEQRDERRTGVEGEERDGGGRVKREMEEGG